ncbi:MULTISPECIES: TRAP transporter large permease [unclassified Pseudoclavibacter]|jgi:tripartite ATP-independent transporter DctM subunit|uniref:TRAP transporter large permease n=1 Tax=unclassified Pseudoclavibacter TaxID=2615177 RepID=UPI000CE8F5B2|nr:MULTISPECIES: TRAP transporter large permease [unclassified Pseudoclavibacter]MBS3179311.1 TRAP transporter large permease [Pseudoclavibacter sp. Marseille-Q4354]PPG27071.1 C4-dicarboxylate ABC transporter permease [Pseudoclavibacter sp. RFBB5]
MPVILGGLLLLLLAIGVPVGISVGLASFVSLAVEGVPPEVGAQRFIAGMRSFPLLAVPLFVLAGAIMNAGGTTQRLIDFAYALVGRIRGGLSAVNVLTNVTFGGMSGSAVADASAVGRLLIPQMLRRGYSPGDAASVTAAASIIALVLPPSITMIIYAVAAEVSIGDLFFHGLYIGLAFGVVYLITGWLIARKKGYPAEKSTDLRGLGRAFLKAIPALLIPVVVLGGIRLGVFTATEGGAVAVTVAAIIGFFVYRGLTWARIVTAMRETAMLVAAIMLIIAMAQAYSWALVTGGTPEILAAAVLGITDNIFVILLVANVLLLLVGTVVEGNAAIIIFTPVLLPIMTAVGVDPVHFGLIVVINLAIGLITPPVGINLLITSRIAGISAEKAMKDMLPWLGVSILLLFIVTYAPFALGWY